MGFPLVGTENFSFPAIINSFEFTPTEDRDGVYLGQSDNKENKENQQIIIEACELLTNVLQFAAESGWRNTYMLAIVPAIQEQSWMNTVWIRSNIKEQFIEKIRQTPIVLNKDDVAIAPEKAWLPVAETSDDIKALWDLLNEWQEGHEILPRRNEAVGWWNVLNKWASVFECKASSFDEAIDGQKLALIIDENCSNIEDLHAEASVNIFAWIVNQKDWNLLRDFPTFAEDDTGDRETIKLERDTKSDDLPLAPVRAWTNDLQPYSELFPWQYILADAFFETASSDVWHELDEQGFLKKNVIITKNMYFNKFLPEESLTDETEEEEEEEHETADRIDVTDIAFLERDNIGIMARVRQSQRLDRIFWRFLTEWLILHDSKGLEINEALCDCEKRHKYYPAKWLVPLVRNKWVPLGKRRAGQATAESLANLLRDSEWKPSSLDRNPVAVELLTAIGVTQFDLLREFVATNDKERNEQNEIFTKILVATSGDLSQISEFVQDLEEDENLLSHLEERREIRRLVHENQCLGQQVESLVKELLEDNGFTVCRTGTGSDYEISIDKDDRRWLIEVKATRDQVVRMSDTQAKTAVEQGKRFLLCVVPVELGDPDPRPDIVQANMKFVKNIGPRVDQLCNNLDGLKELRDEITADESSGVKLEVVSGAARIRVASSVWEGEGFRLEDLAEHLK